jgi:integral membrane protein
MSLGWSSAAYGDGRGIGYAACPSMQHPASFLRTIALAEAVSYLVLLGIAMPLKYAAGMPMAVLIVGSLHGALFVVLCWALLRVVRETRWPLGRVAIVFASLVPIAPFVLDPRVRAWVRASPPHLD